MSITLDEICTLIGLQLGIQEVGANHHIQANLGADSVDLVNIAATAEEKYQIEISETDLVSIKTAADLHQLVLRLAGS